MTMTIAGAVDAIAANARALAGIKEAPARPPESANQFPFALTYPLTTVVTGAANPETKRLVTVVCEIHIARQLLPVAVDTAIVYGDILPIALWNDLTLGGAVNHINEVRGDFVTFEYAGVRTVGWKFEIDMKMED